MNTFRHVILTRFNVKIEQAPPPGRDWLEHRFSLFERFCLPSVIAQTCTDFDWILFCDPDVPPPYLDRLRAYARHSAIRLIYFRSRFDQGMARAAVADLARGYTHLITTRLDNDDAICRTFVETIRSHFRGQTFEFLNFANGFIWQDGRIWSGRHSSNAFISLVEDTRNFSTVYCGNHMELNREGPIVQIAEPAAWLQVVHGKNLSNQAWGRLENGLDLSASFAIRP